MLHSLQLAGVRRRAVGQEVAPGTPGARSCPNPQEAAPAGHLRRCLEYAERISEGQSREKELQKLLEF